MTVRKSLLAAALFGALGLAAQGAQVAVVHRVPGGSKVRKLNAKGAELASPCLAQTRRGSSAPCENIT